VCKTDWIFTVFPSIELLARLGTLLTGFEFIYGLDVSLTQPE